MASIYLSIYLSIYYLSIHLPIYVIYILYIIYIYIYTIYSIYILQTYIYIYTYEIYIHMYIYKKWQVKDKYFWIKVVEMDKKYNGSNGKKNFDFVICYLVILYYNLDLVLNQIASNRLEVVPFWKVFAPWMWCSLRRICLCIYALILFIKTYFKYRLLLLYDLEV